MNKTEEKEICMVCGRGPFRFLKHTKRFGYEVWGCEQGHAQMVKPKTQTPSYPYGYWPGI